MVPGPELEGAREERKGDDASVLVESEEFALDSAAFDVLFEPGDRFGVVGLCWTTEMPSLFCFVYFALVWGSRGKKKLGGKAKATHLGSVHARQADVDRLSC